MKVALVYDRVNKWGGAERVLLALHEIFPDAHLYTSVYNSKKAKWAEVFKIRTSFLQKFPCHTHHEIYASLMPLVFESFSFDEYDLVISVTSESAKGIITKPKTLHICYCLTPTRYLWSGYDEYFKDPLLRFFSRPMVAYLRNWDKIAAKRPDYYIAISREVQQRIKKYYDRDSEVIYPPVDTIKDSAIRGPAFAEASAGKPTARATPHDFNYFLIVSRLVPYKKIDIAIRAFNRLKLPLKIVGTGYEKTRLISISNSSVEFLGHLTEKELLEYYKGCSALIFPGIEDFGLTILEAQAFGKPVIAFKAGGALETIIEGKTGEFFYPQDEDALIKTINKFRESKYTPADCLVQAEKFSKERFKKEFAVKVRELFEKYKKL